MSSRTTVERLYARPMNDLLEELGNQINRSSTLRQTIQDPAVAELFGNVHLFSPRATLGRIQSVRLASQVISKFMPALRHKICIQWSYCKKRSEYTGLQEWITATSPLIAAVTHLSGYGLLVATVIIVKKGLDKLCHCPKTRSRKKKSGIS